MKFIQILVLFLGVALNAYASEIKEIFNRQQPLTIEGVTIIPQNELVSLYSNGKLHTAGNRQYFLLINGFSSRPGNPTAQHSTAQHSTAQHSAGPGGKCMPIFTRLKKKKPPGCNV